jgi:hypothetical protein
VRDQRGGTGKAIRTVTRAGIYLNMESVASYYDRQGVIAGMRQQRVSRGETNWPSFEHANRPNKRTLGLTRRYQQTWQSDPELGALLVRRSWLDLVRVGREPKKKRTSPNGGRKKRRKHPFESDEEETRSS